MAYSQAVADEICRRLAEGESLRSVCRDKEMPDKMTVLRWLDAREDFRAQYARAREIGLDSMAEEIQEISDDGRNDWMERHGDDSAGWHLNGEHVQRSRLRVDSRKWLLSKMAPKKYGDKLDVEHGGTVNINWPVRPPNGA